MAAVQDLAKMVAKVAAKGGWDVLSAMLGDLLAQLRAQVPTILVDRIKRTFTERRKEFPPFLDEMRVRGGDYAVAVNHFQALMDKWQEEKPGVEGWRMRILVDDLYGAFDPPDEPVRPERPVIPAGKGGGAGVVSAPALEAYKIDLKDYKNARRTWRREAKARANLRFEFFKRLGLKSDREIEVILEAVRDNGFWQLVMALPIYEMKQAAKKAKSAAKGGWKAVDDAAGKAAPHINRFADWLESKA